MRELKILFGYEMKKIFRQKLTPVMFAVTFLICVGPAFFSFLSSGAVVEGKKIRPVDMLRMDKENVGKLNGRRIDQALLEETMQRFTEATGDLSTYAARMEYIKNVRPYRPVFDFIGNNSDMYPAEILEWTADEADLHERRLAMLEGLYDSRRLSQREKEYWRKKEGELEWPVRFEMTDCYLGLYYTLSTICFVVPLCLAVCLSGVFAGEHSMRTDQLILCSRKGLGSVYLSKIAAGISFSALYSLAASVMALLPCLVLYGADGFHAAFQLIHSQYSLSVTAGEASFIMHGVLMAASVLFAVLIMLISEAAHSRMAALSGIAIYVVAAMLFWVPKKYRVLSQVWDWLPGSFVLPKNTFDLRMIPVFGKLFLSWQAVPVLYLITAAGIAVLGFPIYRRYQVTGR